MKIMKQLNNKILIITLLLLVAAFVLTRLFRSPGRERNLDASLLKTDTAGITEVRLYPASERRAEIKLTRAGKHWKATREALTASAGSGAVNNLLSTLASLKPERIVSRKKEKRDTYHTGDTTGTRVTVFRGDDELTSLVVGKESGGLTYVRPGGEDEVYAVSGYLSTVFDKSFSHWRDQSFLRIDKDQITKIRFNYPADSSFVMEKNDRGWMIGNDSADSAAIDNYLNKLRSKDLSAFADDFSAAAPPDITISIENKNGPIANIKGWRKSFYEWVLASDLQPDVYFTDAGPVTVKELFVGKGKLLGKKASGK
jgi:hypothetical protein